MERLPDDADRGPKTMSQIPKARNSASRLRAFLLLARDKTMELGLIFIFYV